MTIPTVFDTCTPRSDVLRGEIAEADFAADLASVVADKGSPEYRDPIRFFADTYPTRGLKSLLGNVCRRLAGAGGEVAAIFRLDTSYGGGKTHGLIALTHAARGLGTVPNISEFIDPSLLPEATVRVAAFDGENADPANGRAMGDGVLAYTPWGEIACQQTMVFTQYGDTMEFLREELRKDPYLRLMCYSGRGGEIPAEGGPWRAITRDDAKRRFRLGEADVLLCTDAAAEGLNFQFCGALVNYDMPWNPMRVEQRIGRIDRLGQRHAVVRISNLHYEDTVETDVYRALGSRINLFQMVVGPLQPILARLPGTITNTVLADPRTESPDRAGLREAIERQIDEGGPGGFDIDAVLEEDWTMPERPAPAMTMDDLDRVIGAEDLMPQGTQVRPLGAREYALRAPGMTPELRVTTDPDYYEEHTESVEFWSPGNPLFNPPENLHARSETTGVQQLAKLLDHGPG